MLKSSLVAVLLMASALMAPAFADSDPSMHQIFEAAQTGHLDQAQQMIDQVVKDHPKSAKAHFVAAEIAAKGGRNVAARSELGIAEQLDPGLAFAKPRAVQALKGEIGLGGQVANRGARGASAFPWGMVLVLVAAIGVLWLLFRRRSAPPQYPIGAVAGRPPGTLGGPGYGGPAGGAGAGAVGGMGSGIMGGLASGLAVGAGVVAGEEIARHFLDGGRDNGRSVNNPSEEPSSNSDMGGTDFGVDSPSSWDDSSGGGDFGGGGGDWS